MENARKKVVLATAITQENDVISVWITKAGEITDSVFLLEMAEEITKYFTEKVNNILPESKVKAYSELRDIPSVQLNSSENIETYLQQQPVFSYVRIFVDSDNYNQENTMNMLEQAFDGQDATWYVYLCDNPDAIDLSFYDLSKFDYSGSVEKDNGRKMDIERTEAHAAYFRMDENQQKLIQKFAGSQRYQNMSLSNL